MSTVLRAVLIWLLVLALPMQGAAAAMMVFCGPNHVQPPSIATAHAAPHAPALRHAGPARQLHAETPAGHYPAGHHHHAQHDAGEHTVSHQAASTADTTEGASPHADQHKCSACASCCAAAVIDNTLLRVPASAPTAILFSAVVPTVQKFSSEGPDRPPRALLV